MLPNQKIDVVINFHPDHVSEDFFELIDIFIPNQIHPKKLFIRGCCYKKRMYATHLKPFRFPENVDELIKIQEENLVDLKSEILKEHQQAHTLEILLIAT